MQKSKEVAWQKSEDFGKLLQYMRIYGKTQLRYNIHVHVLNTGFWQTCHASKTIQPLHIFSPHYLYIHKATQKPSPSKKGIHMKIYWINGICYANDSLHVYVIHQMSEIC